MDLVKQIGTRHKNRINFITHPQAVYCPQILSSILTDDLAFYAVSDYMDPTMLANNTFEYTKASSQRYYSLKESLKSLPPDSGFIDEPLLYSLYDMISMALEAAEASGSREQFLSKISNTEFFGASGTISIKDGRIHRTTYLTQWQNGGFKVLSKI